MWYCKSTIFQANHNRIWNIVIGLPDVCDTAKVRFFKQITTLMAKSLARTMMFVILQKYDFSSKSQPLIVSCVNAIRCLWYCKSTIFQANHNTHWTFGRHHKMFVILQKYDFSSKSQLMGTVGLDISWCLWYCKSTIFQANHNESTPAYTRRIDVCDTAKVRFFKQITTEINRELRAMMMFVILQKYDFSSKSQP